ncbi:MAG: glycosyltransferase family 2 protein [Candidatus Woesearchaeota archaeon]|jgi:cellulose synthase/poly-beta-1,6-N-acetylglucosamine synthase-like glycosyltransferase|nr:glycosyltransferase family 2 protein [Candidatus Woesearchaeota archaeon]MDP7180021.1 glycosyltransferase family 2 protein [Candidatus Woesearchaeota archaeon]MDP7457544.1 glycosyltransferase family 2 protein [Candidatus Woesearchaeota archaeon]
MILISEIAIWVAFVISSYFLIFWLLVLLDEDPHAYTIRKKLRRYPLVSVIIPAYNEEDTIIDTLKSVIGLDFPKKKLEIFVVNDGSTDNTKKVVEEFISKNTHYAIKQISQQNKGKGAALNVGLKQCKGEFFACLDADSIVKSNSLKKLLPYFDEGEHVSTVLPLMKLRDTGNFLQKVQWAEYLINFFYKKLMAILDCVHVSPGPFSIYRTAILRKINGFDEKNLTEDLEITLRLQSHQYKIIQTLNAEVYTSAPKKFSEFYAQRNRWYKGSLINMFKKRNLIFNKKYGEFGMLQAPRVASAGILALMLILIAVYHFIKPLKENLIALSHINFDIFTLLKGFNFSISLLEFNYMNLFFALVIFGLGMIIIYYAHQYTKESWKSRGRLAVPAYLVLYSMLLTIVWVGIAFDFLRGKVQKW